MKFSEYYEAALKTAVYPEAGTGSDLACRYCIAGLQGEAGELRNKIKKVWRDYNGQLTWRMAQSIVGELGDVLWYTTMLAREYAWDEYNYRGSIKYVWDSIPLRQYEFDPQQIAQQIARANTIKIDCNSAELFRITAHINLFHANLIHYIPDLVNQVAISVGSSLHEVAKANIVKLHDRQGRGALHGDGDER